MVSTTSAPRTASAALSATVAPTSASGSALARVRFQTLSGIPAAATLRAIPAPMVPVPSRATVGRSVIFIHPQVGSAVPDPEHATLAR